MSRLQDIEVRRSSWVLGLEQPAESGDVEDPLHHRTRMTEHENALFVTKLSFKSNDCSKTPRVDEREPGKVEYHDALPPSSKAK